MRDRYRALTQSVQKHHTSEDTLYSKNTPSLKMGVSVHSPQRLQRVLQWHQPCRAPNFTLLTFKALLHCATPVQSTKYGRVDGNSTGLFGTQRGAKHIGRQTQVADANVYVRWPKQVRSLHGGRHGLLCRCQHQSLLNVGRHCSTRLFKLSRPKWHRIFYKKFHSSRRAQDSQVIDCCCGCSVLCVPRRSPSALNCAGIMALV